MHPALSVVFFTVASGAGYGVLICLALLAGFAGFELSACARLTGLAIAMVLVTAGLLSSTGHLGHPERAWRALSQWRSSWLSREGWAAILSYGPAGWLALVWYQNDASDTVPALAAAAMGVVTLICTAMIYASLRPIPAWRHRLVPVIYLAFGLSTGALVLNALTSALGNPSGQLGVLASVLTLTAWGIKLVYWASVDPSKLPVARGSAIGLPQANRVSLFSAPGTGSNFVVNEMAFRIARKHARKLRVVAITGGAVISSVLALGVFLGGLGATFATSAAALLGLGGTFIERWLFFAEARHVVTLYFDDDGSPERHSRALGTP